MNRHLLLTGSTGFIGGQVVKELARRPDIAVRLLCRPGSQPAGIPRHWQVRYADLAVPESLRGICAGVDTVLHLGHQIGGSRQSLDAVNVGGTRNLVEQMTGVAQSRFVTVSTTGVYGRAARRGGTPSDPVTGPASSTSHSRLAGDRVVLAAEAGLVVRPHFVYGPGDRWFVPRATDIVRRLGWIDGGSARHSVIHLHPLARALVRLSLHPERPSGVLTAGFRQPATMHDLLTRLSRSADPIRTGVPADLPGSDRSVTLAAALTDPNAPRDDRWSADVRLMGEDHFYDCAPFWNAAGADRGEGDLP